MRVGAIGDGRPARARIAEPLPDDSCKEAEPELVLEGADARPRRESAIQRAAAARALR